MLHPHSITAKAVALSLAAAATASTVSYCPSGADSICFAVGIPESTASSGSGNIYFSITAPSSYQWVALGTGSQMSGSNMFVMYQDGNGNLTLSPRLGSGHSTPTLDTSSNAAQLTLLAGSGVSGGVMTANVRCANCESWGSSGSMSVTSNSAPWIGAWKAGSSLATTSQSASISRHDGTAQYSLDLTQATVSSDSNPFVSSSDSGSSGSDSGSSGSDSGSSGSSGSGSSGSDSGSSGSGSTGNTSGNTGVTVTGGGSGSSSSAILIAHAIVLSVVMVVLYPLGSALMPLLGMWLVHGTWQAVSFVLMWIGFGLGVALANQRHMLFVDEARHHTILGTVVVAAFAVQPLLGYLHHRHFVTHQRRGLVSYIHIWWGRVFMLLGIVNGGLGLKLAEAPHSAIIGYSVAAAVISLAYIAGKAVGVCYLARRRERKLNPGPQRSRSARGSRGSRHARHQSYNRAQYGDDAAEMIHSRQNRI